VIFSLEDEIVPALVFLGTSNAIPDEDHENTHMVVTGNAQTILIDSVGNSILRLKQVGIDHNDLTDLILTHFHPDHVSGVPSLLMNMWLLGRRHELNIYGLQYTLERLEKLMDYYDWATWPNFFPVHFHNLPEEEKTLALESNQFRIYSSPVHHLIPTIGLRVEFVESGKTLAYSCDTEPCEEVVRLAEGVDVLIHEASGATLGHTSASQAGSIATRAQARSLYLIHYPTRGDGGKALIDEAGSTYRHPVALAQDFMRLEF
jgi:ribonuclease Z